MKTYTPEELAKILELHAKWLRGEPEGVRASLVGASLDGARLDGASLVGASLVGASLVRASLDGARLDGARLDGARLVGASLSKTTLIETGETWENYCTLVVPALLTAGGKPLAVAAASWDCHTWENCPLHAAFDRPDGTGARGTDDLPILLRPRGEQFLRWFDAKKEDGSSLIPNPLGDNAACPLPSPNSNA